MIRYFFRHLWESIKNLKRNGLMTLAAISSVTITLTLVGLFAAVLVNTDRLARGIENNIQINVYLQPDSTDAYETVKDDEGKTIVNDNYHVVYDQIMAFKNVEKIDFSSKTEELKRLKDTFGNDWKVFDGDANPLSDVYVVQTKSPDDVKSVAKELRLITGIENVTYGGVNTERLFKFADFIKIWGLAGIGILIFVAVFLISNTIRITIFSRRRDIEIMRLVGATNSYIRGPFFLEGAWVGLLGSIIPGAILYVTYFWAYGRFNGDLLEQSLSLYQPTLFLPFAIGGIAIIGIVIGSLGSVLSMRRFLKI